MKELGSTLEVGQQKNRSQSLSNIDILISPCDPDHVNPNTCPACPRSDTEANTNVDKNPLEAALSFPLWRPKVTHHSSFLSLGSPASVHRKSIDIIYSPASPDLVRWQRTFRSPSMPHLRLSSQTDREHGEDAEDSHHGDGGEGVPSEKLLLGDNRMYPTLRSKSLNAKPRKTRRKEEEEKPRSAGSIKDLVSAFGGRAEVQDQVQRVRLRDCGSVKTKSPSDMSETEPEFL